MLRQDNIINAPNASTGWTAFTTQQMTPPAGTTTAKIRLYGGTVAGATWYVDDITLSTVTPTQTTTSVWSYPNIHGDTQAVADAVGIKQGTTFTYDPYGNALTGIVDNQASEFDNGWLGQHQRSVEHQTGLTPLIEMGARGYNPTLGRFLQQDPIEGGTSNDYMYVADPIDFFDLNGLTGGGNKGKGSRYGNGRRQNTWPGTNLPTGGEYPFVPRKGDHGKPKKLPRGQGYIDASGNRWTIDKEKRNVGNTEWDVQHPDKSHTNVNPGGHITERIAIPSGSDTSASSTQSQDVIKNVGTGVAIAGTIYVAAKVLSPFCGPFVIVCAVAL